jgi:2-oxoglutarate ferredoxin oxidoreductase subunit delta
MSDRPNASKLIEIEINEAWCKGCVICVELCPQDVLMMENGIAKVKDLEACTACGLCELRCPDFAIEVIDNRPLKEKTEVE